MPDNPFYDAIETIERRGWRQGGSSALVASGPLCLGVLTSHDPGLWVTLCDVLGLNDNGRPACDQLAVWNDAPERTYEDVILALKHAAEAWDARG